MKAPRVRSGLRVPIDLNSKLIMLAEEEGISKNALMLRVLWDWVKKKDLEEWNLKRDKDIKHQTPKRKTP